MIFHPTPGRRRVDAFDHGLSRSLMRVYITFYELGWKVKVVIKKKKLSKCYSQYLLVNCTTTV